MNKLFFLFISCFLLSNLSYGQCTGCPTVSMSGVALQCYGASTGQATVTVSGGSGSYSYSWSSPPGGNTNSISGLMAGTYTVLVTDLCTGCIVTGAYTVNSPDPISISGVVTDVSCFGGSNGQINLTVTGGTPGPAAYYDWSNNGVTAFPGDPMNFTTASLGTYTVTYRDNFGCSASKSFSVNQPPAALGLTYTKIEVDCFNASTGSINISPFGGTPPYAFDWNNDGIGDWNDTEDIANLSAQTYNIGIRDYKNCLYNQNIIITQPAAALNSVTTGTDVSCYGGSDGAVNVTLLTGGTSPYNYAWSNSTFVYSQNAPGLSNVPSDIYTVVITDDNGCIITDGAVVNSPNALSVINSTLTNISCNGYLDGQINVSVTGGTGAYSYVWTGPLGIIGGATSNILSNVGAGDYSVLIEDANGCQLTKNYTLTEPALPLGIVTNTITPVLCYGMNTGAINISPVGGTPGYSYVWQNSSLVNMGVTEDLSVLFADIYNVVLTDANGCVATANFNVTQPADTLIATSIITPVNCYGESNGSINVNTTGGTSPYSYEWTNSTYQLSVVSEDLTNYPSDTYYVVITDLNNCQFITSYFIAEPTLLTGSVSGVNILCRNDNTGSIDLSVNGGVLPYNYLWDNGPTTEDQSNLFAGTYSVLVTDDNFCEFTTSITLTEPDDTLSFSYTTENVTCFGESNGAITLIPIGGTPAYSVDWSTGENATTITDLTAGWYIFDLVDNNGCQEIDSIEITQPDILLANEVVTDVTCFGFSDGIIDISPSGGTAPYNYTWFNSTFALSSQLQDLNGFPYDVYQLELRDSLNCFTEIYIELPQPEPLVITAEQVDVTCAGGTDGSIDVDVTGGNPAYSYLWTNGYTTQDIENVPVDEYTLVVTDTKNCVDSITIIIYEPEPIVIDFLLTEVSCADQFDGSAFAMPSGGTGDFTYVWSNGETNSLIEGIYGGDYSVTVTDIVGCMMTDSAFVTTSPIACIDPPTAFTPNGDNYNDTWFLKNIEIYPDMNIKIFNRWGNLVSEHDKEYEEWNGIYHGQPLPSETYYYIINLNTNLDPLKGTITIIR